jgi:hypothetical protein
MYLYEGRGTTAVRHPGLRSGWHDRRLTDSDSVGNLIAMVALVVSASEGRSDVSIWSSVFPKCFHFQNW